LLTVLIALGLLFFCCYIFNKWFFFIIY
jgi:hypothetical protein